MRQKKTIGPESERMSNVSSKENRGAIGPGEFLRRRETLGKSQADMAEALGVTQPAISLWENGERPVPDWVPKLLRYLEASAARDAKAASQSSTGGEVRGLQGHRSEPESSGPGSDDQDARKAGSVIERGRDRYLIRLFLGRNEQGKRIYKSTAIRGRREEAEAELEAWIRMKEEGILAVPAGEDSSGKGLRARRLRLGVTEDELSEILDVPKARISELEREGGQLPRWLALAMEALQRRRDEALGL